MNDDKSSVRGENNEACRPCYASMDKVELEALAIEAIKEHRRLFETDQHIYDEWEKVEADPCSPHAVIQALEEQYLARQKRTALQQEELSDVLNALGFIPSVPADIVH
ncbi:transcriptional repressor TraM [Pararhizobium sp. BT-229]|uniref:transcriptional repressor TraM n=1 Tax=Pararhizobium sp. BT-229 TaxID=2986923 RepID=UPI0021F710C3|nr:transcriptional repressor TraM [Pararhizobium sp. BT-229]MCV9966929.1 transcriptional repressor TraM [Pararhizobium sp. BT-229]